METAAGTRPHPRPVVVLNLLSLGRLCLQSGEVGRVLAHRHMQAGYLVALFGFVTFDFNGAADRLSGEFRGTVYILAIGTALAVVALAIRLALALAARRDGRITLHLSPLLMLATLCSVMVGDLVYRLLAPPDDPSLLRLALVFSFHYLVAEFAAIGLAHMVMPAILSELRGLPIRTLADTDPALWSDDPAPEAAPAPETTGFLAVGDRSIPLRGLIHLQADGNYVHLWTTDRRELLPGPLADLTRQIPPDLGRQVHRSHWVAAGAIRTWRIDGREITLLLSSGQTAPVALTRRREVRDWLATLDLPKTPAP